METVRKRLESRMAALRQERQSFDSHYRELYEQFYPRRGRLHGAQQNRGDKRNRHLINNTPLRARRTLQAGMMSGLTSPARPWFRLSTPDPAMAEHGEVKRWLGVVEERMRMVFARSNIYTVLPAFYGELATIGTAAFVVLEDDDSVIRVHGYTGGQYCIGDSHRGHIDTLAIDMEHTVRQVVQEFGLAACSRHVADLYRRGDLDARVPVSRLIAPRADIDTGLRLPYVSAYWEPNGGRQGDPDVLALRGFNERPMMVARWDVVAGDIYGSDCPGMDALGDSRALQHQEKRKAQAIDKMVDPPLRAPATMANKRISTIPGDITYEDPNLSAPGSAGVAPIYEVKPDAQLLLDDIAVMEERVHAAFFADLFLMLAQSDRRQITAREVEERHEEKLLQLGPVLERLNDDVFDPLMDRVFAIMVRKSEPYWQGLIDGEPLLPPPPEEMQGQALRVEYTSILAQAQKLVGITGLERLVGYVQQAAAIAPTIVDKIDWDQTVDEMSDMLGTPFDVVRSDEAVEEARAARAQAEQAQAMAAAAQPLAQAASAAQTLSQTPVGGDSALDRMLSGMGAPL